MNRKYEIGFVINPETPEEDTKKVIDSVVEVITKGHGSVENIDEWGRRPMAYPIQKHTEGIYVFINTEMPGSAYADVERRLKLTEKIMRFLIIRLDDKLKKANKLTKKWQRMERLYKKNSSTQAQDESNNNREEAPAKRSTSTNDQADE